MSSLVKYYMVQVACFVGFALFNIAFYSTYSVDKCTKQIPASSRLLYETVPINNLKLMEQSTFTARQFNSRILADQTSVANSTSVNSTSEPTIALITVNSSISLVSMPLLIVIIYGIMTALTLLALAGIIKFRSLPSESFGNLPWYLGCCGFYVRNYAFLIKLLSYLGFLLIGIEAAFIFFTSDCTKAKHTVVNGSSVQQIEGAMYNQAILVLIVDLCMWGFSHIILPLVKKNLDQEAFLYEPVDNSTNFVYYVCCNVLGP